MTGNGAANALDAELNRHIQEKTTQNKVKFQTGNVKGVSQKQKDFLKTNLLEMLLGFITNSEKAPIQDKSDGKLVLKNLSLVSMANVRLQIGK